jgi:hypothetical protein
MQRCRESTCGPASYYTLVGSFGRLKFAHHHHEMFVSTRALLLPSQPFSDGDAIDVGDNKWVLPPASAEFLAGVMHDAMQLMAHGICYRVLGKHRYSHKSCSPHATTCARLLGRLMLC